MKRRRTLIHLLAACALLVQGLAIAWTAPAMALMPASTSAAMSHCNMAPADEQAQRGNCCCADQCECLEMCSAGAGITVQTVSHKVSAAVTGRSLAPSALLFTVALPVPLHPPIT